MLTDWKPPNTGPHSLPTPPDSQSSYQYHGPPPPQLHHPGSIAPPPPRSFPPPGALAGPPPPHLPPPTSTHNPPPRYGGPLPPYETPHRPAPSPSLLTQPPPQYRSGPEGPSQHDSPDAKSGPHPRRRVSSVSRYQADSGSPLNPSKPHPSSGSPAEPDASPRQLTNRETHPASRDMEYHHPYATPLLEHMREQHQHHHTHPSHPGHGPPQHQPPPPPPASATPTAPHPHPHPPHLDTSVGPSYGAPSQPQSAPPYATQPYPYSAYDAHNSMDSSQKRKAVRASQACDNCRAKKAKCDENRPCGNCSNQNIQCNFRDMPAPKQERSMIQLSEQVNGLGRRMETMETLLQRIAGQFESDLSSPSAYRTPRERHYSPEGYTSQTASADASNHSTGQTAQYVQTDHRSPDNHGPSPQWHQSEHAQSHYLPNGNYLMHPNGRVQGQRYSDPQYDEDQNMTIEENYESELSREVARRGQDAHEDMLSKDYLNGSVALAPRHLTAANHLIDWPTIASFFAGIAGRTYVKRGEYHHSLDLRHRPRKSEQDSRNLSTPVHSPLGGGMDNDDSSTISNVSDGRPAMAFVRQGGEGSRGLHPTPGGRNPRDQSLSIDHDSCFRLMKSYFNNIHILQPFLDRDRAEAMVQQFVNSYYFEPTHTSSPMEHTSSQGSTSSTKRRKVNHGLTYQGRPPSAKIPIARTVENALVLLILALGKVCEHEGPLPPLIYERKIIPEGTPVPEGVICTPSKGQPGMVETRHVLAQEEGSAQGDQHGSDPYSNDIDRIPGLAYYVHAAQILGEVHGDNSLAQVHARLLAGLYLGQLLRVNESWQWIKAACDAWQMLFKQRDEMLGRLSDEERAGFWACLMLESDILAEHDCIPSGISKWEDAFTANDDSLLKINIDDPAEEEKYCFFVQGIVRSILNRAHSALYVADEDKEKNSEWQKLSSEDYLKQLSKWRSNLPSYLSWEDFEEPADSINRARLRGKYWGGRYMICRPYLRAILDPEFQKSKSHDENERMAQHANKANDINYAKTCVRAAERSTLAFDNVPGMIKRLIVTNPFGTAQAQFSNIMVLSAAYCADHFTGFIQEREILFYIDRTREFLSYLAALSPTMATDVKILDNTKRIVMKKNQERVNSGTNSANTSFQN